jgi:hypothetical protein
VRDVLAGLRGSARPHIPGLLARKISQGKRDNQALIALARRRCDVLFAMLRDGTFYSPPRPEKPLTTT